MVAMSPFDWWALMRRPQGDLPHSSMSSYAHPGGFLIGISIEFHAMPIAMPTILNGLRICRKGMPSRCSDGLNHLLLLFRRGLFLLVLPVPARPPDRAEFQTFGGYCALGSGLLQGAARRPKTNRDPMRTEVLPRAMILIYGGEN
jgi:hypothetical protein